MLHPLDILTTRLKSSERCNGRSWHNVGARTTPEVECKTGVSLAVNARDLGNWRRIGRAGASSDADLRALHVCTSAVSISNFL